MRDIALRSIENVPTARAALEQVTVMEQAVEHGADGSRVAKEFAPVLGGAVGGDQSAGAFITAHDDFQQILGKSYCTLIAPRFSPPFRQRKLIICPTLDFAAVVPR